MGRKRFGRRLIMQICRHRSFENQINGACHEFKTRRAGGPIANAIGIMSATPSAFAAPYRKYFEHPDVVIHRTPAAIR